MKEPLTDDELDELHEALSRAKELAEEMPLVLDIEVPLREVAAEVERRARRHIL